MVSGFRQIFCLQWQWLELEIGEEISGRVSEPFLWEFSEKNTVLLKLNKLLINEAEDAIEAELEESKVLFGQDWKWLSLHFLKECDGASSNNGRGRQVYF